ncbi:MAG: malate dehydrogenase [Dehalococcoidia bacterium]|jgi:malate dehydrogenase|uniref:Malate dehydrogenase n=1 Tax=Tepidiforma bonchosmolovskayae TaxID=2601677 RepID=A0ABX6C367_9CHLR|nr:MULTISPECIES: malate dehydrogenase [Tepidiforma]MCL6643691.1 malate dehydrogenase [Dehalococcoidia bacterium]QFG03721.1 malate dehydrogenase [Tepidiforma bonchosmolovskayae]GIW14981.1 MAG: malate dehydrogenase [Tepidiforma sp.]
MPRKKVTIVGAGMTGGAMAQRLIERDICDVVLQDDPQFAGTMHHGKALDESQAAPWEGFSTRIIATDGWEETAGSDVVVVTAGAPRKPGMSREELLNGNAEIVRSKVAAAAKASPNAVIIVFSNPMDAMCHVAMQASGFPRERVIGQGGALDSARYRYFIAAELGVSVNDVHGYVIGGHTDTTMVPVVSQTRVGGVPLTDLLPPERVQAIVARAMRGGAEIGELYKTGSAYFAPSAATIAMVEAILLDQRRLIPCSVYHQGEYGIRDVFSGTVCQLGEGGIQRTFELPLTDEERAKVIAAAEATKELLKLLN